MCYDVSQGLTLNLSNPFLREKKKNTSPPSLGFMDNEVKDQGFTNSLVCPTGFWRDATTDIFRGILFVGLVIAAWLPAARALERGRGRGGVGAAARGGGGDDGSGVGQQQPRVDGVVVVVGGGGGGGGGLRLLEGLRGGRHRRRDGPHHVRVEGGGGGGDGGRGG